MPEKEMFPGKVNSPLTSLAENIGNDNTSIEVVDADKLPDAPNISTIGRGEDAETIKYEGKDGNTLTSVTRGFQGDAKSWDSGTQIARMFTAHDWDGIRQNHNAHKSDEAPHEYGGRFKWQYNETDDSLEMVVVE